MQTKIRSLIWVPTVCLQNVLLKLEKKENIPHNNSKIGNEVLLLVKVGMFIQLKWIKHHYLRADTCIQLSRAANNLKFGPSLHLCPYTESLLFSYALTLCIQETPKRVLLQTVKTQMLHFIRVYTVCKGKKDLQTKEHNTF